jgi:hypothetical protein
VEFDAHVADSTGVHGISDTSALLTTTAAAAAYVSEGAAFADIAGYAGVDATGTNECAAAINAALATILAAGQRAYAKGTFKIASTVTIAGNADLGDATFNYTGTSGTAILVGSATLGDENTGVHLRVTCPVVVATAKTVTGWAQVTGTIGIDLSNVSSSIIEVPLVTNFETNLRCYGKGAGFAYNSVTIGHLANGKVSHLLDADSTGWCNENTFMVGRYSHVSDEGSNVVGTRQLVLNVCTNPINNNTFLSPCFEGNTAEFHASIGGIYNRLIQGRWEATTPKVQWASDSSANTIDGGYGAGSIVETFISGSLGDNNLLGRLRHYHSSGGGTSGSLVLENYSSAAYPTDVVMGVGARVAGSSPATAYAVHRGPNYTRMKRTTDTYDRVIIDHVNGRVYFGNGASDALSNGYIGGGSGYVNVEGSLYFLTTNTHDLGSDAYRPRDLYLGRNIEIDGALNHDGTTVGFYGTTPTAKQTGVAVTAEAIHAALVSLGLIGA